MDKIKKIFNTRSLLFAFLKSLGLLVLLSMIYAIIFLFNYNETESYFLAYIVFIILIISKNKEYFTHNLKDIKKIDKKLLLKTLGICLIFTVLSFVANKILVMILGHTALNEQSNIETLNKLKVYAYINMLVLAPISEELIFRYPYKDVSGKKFPVFIFYVIMFALAHITLKTISDYIFLIPYTFTSLSISYMYYKTDNIYMSIIYHIFNNLIAVMLLLI